MGSVAETSSFTDAEVERGLRLGVVEGALAFASLTIATGAVLAALVVFVGMGPEQYGVLAAMPFLATLLQLPNVVLLRRFPRRKLIAVGCSGVGRFSLLLVPIALLFFPPALTPSAIFLAFGVWSVLGALAAGAWLWWMQDLVPTGRLGSYFGGRGAVLLAVSAPILIGAGLLIDFARATGGALGERDAFSVLYVLAAALGIAGAAVLSTVPHRPPRQDPRAVPLGQSLSRVAHDRNFRRMLSWLVVWGFGSTLTVPFLALYMLTDLGLSITAVTAMLGLGTATNILFLRLWGRLSDRFGNKPVLASIAPVLATAFLLTPLIPAGGGAWEYVLLGVVQVLVSIAVAGGDLAAWNLAFKMGRGPNAPAYLAATSFVRGLATGTGPIVGGILLTALAGAHYPLILPFPGLDGTPLVQVTRYPILFLLGAVLVFLSTVPLTRVVEEGELSRSELVRALRVAAASETLLPGVRHFATATTVAVTFIVEADERAHISLDAGLLALAKAFDDAKHPFQEGEPPPPGQP